MQAVQPLLSCCAQPTWTQLNRVSTNQPVDPFVLKKRASDPDPGLDFAFRLRNFIEGPLLYTVCIPGQVKVLAYSAGKVP